MIYLLLLFAFVLGYVTRPLFFFLLDEGGLIRENYQRKSIPLGMGIYLFFNLTTVWSIGYIVNIYSFEKLLPIVLLTVFFAFFGFIDDLLGNRKAKGLIEHFGCLLKGELTTGGLKALGAGVIGLVVVSYITDTFIEAFIGWFTLLLLTNFINLLDLRPGRALKVFSFLILTLFLFSWQRTEIWSLAIPLVPVLFFYFPLDLKGNAMLGDTGANLLGGILGYFTIQLFNIWIQAAVLFTLALIHLYAEQYSLSVLIEKNRVLNWFDRLGRE